MSATVLGDGEIVLILNPVALSAPPPPPRTRRTRVVRSRCRGRRLLHLPTVMVVDDSLTVRRSPGRLLEREGRIACSPPGTAWTRSSSSST